MKPPRAKNSFSFPAAVAVSLALLLSLVAALVWQGRQTNDSVEELFESHRSKDVFQDLLAALADAEAAERGFLLTADRQFLTPFHEASRRVPPLLLQLAATRSDFSIAARDRERLADLIRRKMTQVQTAIELVEAGQQQHAVESMRSRSGNETMAEIRQIIRETLQNEAAFVVATRQQKSGQERAVRDIVLVLIAATIASGSAVAWILRHQHRSLRRAVLRIAEINNMLEAQNALSVSATNAKTRFIAAASHDLRQPLNALNLLVGALKRRVDAASEVGEITRDIGNATASMLRMFNALLDVSRMDSGAVQPKFAPVALASVVEPLTREYRMQAADNDIELRAVACDAWLWTDEPILETILRNFISNALKFTERGRILVGCRRAGAFVRIQVWDTGPGIPPHQIGLIFEEFERLGRRGNAIESGLGLGLSIVKRLAALIDARISVRSEPGRGSCFEIKVRRADPPLVAAPDAEAAALVGGAARILLVDDDEAILRSMRRELSDHGFDVSIAKDPAEAMARLDPPPEILILDLHLGDRDDGLELYQRIVAALGHTVPALVTTGSTDPASLERLKQSGLPWLHKPVDAEELRAVLQFMSIPGEEPADL